MASATIPIKVVVAEVEPLAVPVADAAKLLGISDWLLRQEIETGTFPHVRIGTRIVIPLAGARRWVAEHTAGMPESKAAAS